MSETLVEMPVVVDWRAHSYLPLYSASHRTRIGDLASP